MKGTATLASAALLAAALGCSRTAVVESGPGARTEVTGTVRQMGSVPTQRTVIEAEERFTVRGRHADELARIAGARVRVTGTRMTGEAGPWLDVASYEILSVDGETPVVGILVGGDGTWWLETREGEVALSAVPERLRRAEGARIWVVTGPDGSSVSRYGILAEADGEGP